MITIQDFNLTTKPTSYFCYIGPSTHIISKKAAEEIIKQLIKNYNNISQNDIDRFNNKISTTYHNHTPISKKPTEGYIYFLQNQDNAEIIKIGKTTNLKNRFDQIVPKLPFKTKLVHTLKTSDNSTTEDQFHELFNKKHINGEWFNLTEQDIQNIINKNLPQNILDLIIDKI